MKESPHNLVTWESRQAAGGRPRIRPCCPRRTSHRSQQRQRAAHLSEESTAATRVLTTAVGEPHQIWDREDLWKSPLSTREIWGVRRSCTISRMPSWVSWPRENQDKGTVGDEDKEKAKGEDTTRSSLLARRTRIKQQRWWHANSSGRPRARARELELGS